MKDEHVASDDDSDQDLDIETGELTGERRDPSQTRGQNGPTSALADDGEAVLPSTRTKKEDNKKAVVAWRDLPRKRQLVIITLARMSEPLTQTSLQVRPVSQQAMKTSH